MTLNEHEQSLNAARAQILAEAGSWSQREREYRASACAGSAAALRGALWRSSAARERAYQIAAGWSLLASRLDPLGHPEVTP